MHEISPAKVLGVVLTEKVNASVFEKENKLLFED